MLLWPRIPRLLVPGVLLWSLSTAAQGSSDPSAPSALCVSAAQTAAEETGVPLDALLAIAVVETGRDRRPWPWTVNLGGEGHWLETAEDAAALVQQTLDQGATNIDIGCFQLNYRWHAWAFRSVEDMLDPSRNALRAARYLAEQYARTGDWVAAAGAYHSSTPEYADRYKARFREVVADLGQTPPYSPDQPEPRGNGFPLLMAGASGRNGSLVPATSGGLRLFGAP